jgi:predicted nucleic acid-binding protein
VIVLDTNIVSEFDKPAPDTNVQDWLARQDPDGVYICGPTVMEQAYGAERILLKSGSNRYHDALRILIGRFRNRILEFVDPSPLVAGKVRVKRASLGRPVSVQDSMIAAICIVHGATLATRNVRDFEGVGLPLVNPFEAAS